MFIGRENELNELNVMYQTDRFEMAVVYGRRRVGKSELLTHFCSGKKAIFFTAIENSASFNLIALVESITNAGLGGNNSLPRDFMQALDIIVSAAKDEKLVFVIDEYPYLAKAEKAFSSVLQKYIDTHFKKTDMMLILCGSSMSFMERQVLSSKSPLYGRRTAQFKIEPFDYFDAIKFVPKFSKEDKLLTYGIFGGTAYYLAQINDNFTLSENVCRLFFAKTGLLFEEPSNLIKQELREPQIYNAIITTIANGNTRLSEISSKINKPANLCDIYIKKLIALGLIAKERPVGEKTAARSIYVLKDNMFKFWFYYVQKSLPLIAKGVGDKALKDILPSTNRDFGVSINEYMGRIFETICNQYLWNNYNLLPLQPKEIGRWWGNNPLEKKEEEIDILAFDGSAALFGECKFRNEKTGIAEYENLFRKSMMFEKHTVKYYYLFSKSGFTEQLIQLAQSNEKIKLIELDNII